jgi:hypothetical protein
MLILTPEHPDFYPILHSCPPPGWRSKINSDFKGCFAVRAGSNLLEPLLPEQEREYLETGEYDHVLNSQDGSSNC